MSAVSPMRAMYAVCLAVAIITGVVALSIDTTITKGNKSSKEATITAFSILGVIFVIIAFVLMVLLLVACADHYKPMMVVIIICTALALVSFSISVGFRAGRNAGPLAWTMASVWVSVICVLISVVFLFSDPESI